MTGEARSDLHVPMEDRAAAILRFLDSRERFGHLAPTIREIGDAIGLSSSSSAFDHIQSLHRRGLIDWEPKLARSIRLRHRGGDVCPACGGTGRRRVGEVGLVRDGEGTGLSPAPANTLGKAGGGHRIAPIADKART